MPGKVCVELMGDLGEEAMFRLVVMVFFIILLSACGERQDNDTVAFNTPPASSNSANKNFDAEMDGFDRSRLSRALEFNAVGSGASWTNPITNLSFSVVPLDSFVTAENNCRRYELNVTQNKNTNKHLRRACRNAIGSWADQ